MESKESNHLYLQHAQKTPNTELPNSTLPDPTASYPAIYATPSVRSPVSPESQQSLGGTTKSDTESSRHLKSTASINSSSKGVPNQVIYYNYPPSLHIKAEHTERHTPNNMSQSMYS